MGGCSSVMGCPELEADALLFEQESATLVTLSTLMEFAELSLVPETLTICPTWSARLLVSPVNVKLVPLLSRRL